MYKLQVAVLAFFLSIISLGKPLSAETNLQLSKHTATQVSKESHHDKRGHRGKHGHRNKGRKRGVRGAKGGQGAKGDTGPAGAQGLAGVSVNGVQTYISAYEDTGVTVGPGANLQFAHIYQNSGFALNNGVFTCTAGPGLYEVTFGAAWSSFPYIALQLLVNDMMVCECCFPFNAASGFPTRMTTVLVTTSTVTFNIQSCSTKDSLQLVSQSPGIGAFIAIRKLS